MPPHQQLSKHTTEYPTCSARKTDTGKKGLFHAEGTPENRGTNSVTCGDCQHIFNTRKQYVNPSDSSPFADISQPHKPCRGITKNTL